MTDELKHKFEALVTNAPPPSGVPSEAVFERVRAVKRRRTATAGILATAVVVAAAIAAGNLANLNSAPLPPAHTPAPTAPPTPTTAPSTPTLKTTIGGSVNTLPPVSNTNEPSGDGSDTPASNDPSSPGTSAPGPVKLNLTLETTYVNQKLTVRVRQWGSMLVPLFRGKSLPSNTSFPDTAVNYGWDWGDGTYDPPQGKNGSGLSCDGATKRVTGDVTSSAPLVHEYTAPGTFTFEYIISYCGPKGLQTVKKTKTVTANQPHDY